ncbi:MAG: RagB/SusD family nutrient uptake outer membrane protein [Prevotella sp.]
MRKNLVNGMKRSMNMTMKLLGAAFFILQSSFFISCSDMLDSDSSRQVFEPALDQKTDSVFYALGILQGMQQLADQYMFQGEMRGDLVETTTYTDKNLRDLANFAAHQPGTVNKYDSAYVYYRVINNCNYYIAHRDTTLRTGATFVAMKEFIAVKAIRAWAYMQLTRIYEKVPFYTEPLTQISQINDSDFPQLDMAGIVSRLAPDLEQYTDVKYKDYWATPTFGSVAPSSILPDYLFIPFDLVLGDMYLETDQYSKAASHYIRYLTEVVPMERNHTAYMQPYSRNTRRMSMGGDELPSDWSQQRNQQISGSTSWEAIFTGNSEDNITYIPLAPSKLQGQASEIPLAYGYDYYANTASYVDEIQIVPSKSYVELANSVDFYYITTLTTETQLNVGLSKLGDTRYRSMIYEDPNAETDEVTTWITKNRTPRIQLYRRTSVLLRLAEAFNRLGMYDAAFGILKDGINKYLVSEEGGAQYITPETREALKTTYPLLSAANVSKFSEAKSFFGVHGHGAGYTRDYTGTTYQPGLSPYQCDTIVGLKMKEIAAQFGVSVGTTKQDTINAVEDLICDEMALESAFEGSRWFDLKRLARHKNEAALYSANFGGQWLARKLAFKSPVVNLEDKNNWYLPFK